MSSQSSPQKTETKPTTSELPTCFTIMPFGGWFDSYYKEIFCPAIEKANFSPKRADDVFRPGTIVHDIWAYTKEAKIILADLTGKNPNVLYELGLAHAIARPAILVTESLEDIPFDLRALRIIEYDKNAHNWGELLATKITTAIKEISKSPLKAVLPAFLEVDESKAKVSPHDKELITIQQELDSLKREFRRISSIERELQPEEAKALIKSMIDTVPDDEIVVRLRRLGAPNDWVVRKITQFREAKANEIPF